MKRCYDNMQQVYRRTAMLKCEFWRIRSKFCGNCGVPQNLGEITVSYAAVIFKGWWEMRQSK